MRLKHIKKSSKMSKKRPKTRVFCTFFVTFLLVFSAFQIYFTPEASAWDGRWTRAVSGEWPLVDPGSSEGKTGIKEHPQTFFIPPPRDFADVDPEEMDEAAGRMYTPYSAVRFTQDLSYLNKQIPQGFYQVKLGQWNDGSPNVNLSTQGFTGGQQPQLAAPVSQKTYQVFVLKKLGKVIAVVPIASVEKYQADRKFKNLFGLKPSRDSYSWIDYDAQGLAMQPVLKFYYKKKIYATPLATYSTAQGLPPIYSSAGPSPTEHPTDPVQAQLDAPPAFETFSNGMPKSSPMFNP